MHERRAGGLAHSDDFLLGRSLGSAVGSRLAAYGALSAINRAVAGIDPAARSVGHDSRGNVCQAQVRKGLPRQANRIRNPPRLRLLIGIVRAMTASTGMGVPTQVELARNPRFLAVLAISIDPAERV